MAAGNYIDPFGPRKAKLKRDDLDIATPSIVEIRGKFHVAIYFHEDSGSYHYKPYDRRDGALRLQNQIVHAINKRGLEALDLEGCWWDLPRHLLANVEEAYERHLEDRGNTEAWQAEDALERSLEFAYFNHPNA